MFHTLLTRRLLAGLGVLLGFLTIGPAAAVSDARHPQAVRIAHFATLPFRETPFADLAGLHRMTPEAAREHNHYRFEFDALDRPVRVSFRFGETVRDLDANANYYFEAPRIDIAYAPGLERRTYFDRHGNRIAVKGNVFEAVFELDERGYRRSLRFQDTDGMPVETNWGVGLYTWRLLPDGTVVEHREGLDGIPAPLRAGFPFFDVRLHYGPQGYLALMQNFGDGSALTLNPLNAAQDRLDYDANGDMRAWNVLDVEGRPSVGNGPGVARGTMAYNERGLQTRQAHFDAAGEPMISAYGWGETRTWYDRYGNITRRGNFALDGVTPADNPRLGYSAYTYRYADNGRDQVELALLRADGSPAAHPRGGFSVRQQRHDASGNVIETVYYDAAGVETERLDNGVSRRQMTHDEQGRRTGARLFGVGGVPVNHASEGWHIETVTYLGATAAVERVRWWSVDGTEVPS